MNSKFGRMVISAFSMIIVICLMAVFGRAQQYRQIYSGYSDPYPNPYPVPVLGALAAMNGKEEDKRTLEGSVDAADVFSNIVIARNEIPREVLQNAAAIGVFKGVFNPADVGGYRRGNGAITVRTRNGWSAPVFYKMGSGDYGSQPGASSANYFLVFMNPKSIKGGEFNLNLDSNVSPGPTMESATYTDSPNSKMIYAYSHRSGSLEGAVINDVKLSARDILNRDLYGADAITLLTDPSQLPNMCEGCLSPEISDSPMAGGFTKRAVAVSRPRASRNSCVSRRSDCISSRNQVVAMQSPPIVQYRNNGARVIIIKIINDDNEDDDDDCDDDDSNQNQVMVVTPPQVQTQSVQMVPCCPQRVHVVKQ